jgi:formylglycine-generating enzyme required for sulfatase activity
MKNILLILIFALISITIWANNVQVTSLVKTGSTITFDLQWENSWRSSITYHDAVWVFVKQAANGGPSWEHANVSTATVDSGYETVVPSDEVGFFVRRSENGNGTATTSVTATLLDLNGAFQDLKVMAIEMVYVPTGEFYAGDGASSGRIARGDDELESVHITSDGALTCGSTSSDIQFLNGTCLSDIPETFPKGYSKFYSMKYVITQKQYVDFLNCLPRNQQENRVFGDVTNSTVTNVFVLAEESNPLKGNVVRCDENIGTGNITFYCDRNNNGVRNEMDDGLSRACNYLRKQDWTAYLDWSGLRPWTFLEVEKAARGPLLAVQNEYSWGSPIYTDNGTLQNAGTESENWSNSGIDGGINTYLDDVVRVGCNAPSSGATRGLSGASFYGIIDIGNNPGDWYVSKVFKDSYDGVQGDGMLDSNGDSNVLNWPIYDGVVNNFIKIPLPNWGISYLNGATNTPSLYAGGRGVRSNF